MYVGTLVGHVMPVRADVSCRIGTAEIGRARRGGGLVVEDRAAANRPIEGRGWTFLRTVGVTIASRASAGTFGRSSFFST